MTWNYRVFKNKHGQFQIHEVYYDKKGKIKAWSAEPVEPYGESTEELTGDLTYMLAAVEKEIIIEEDLERDHASKER